MVSQRLISTRIRIMGVLQRIALCYLAGGLLYLFTSRREQGANGDARGRGNVAAIACTAVILLIGYWALMTFVPVPGYGAGHLEPEKNLGAYIDRALMGGHLWSESVTWDPEGFLSTLPAIATLLIGILAGEWMRSEREGSRKALGLVGRRNSPTADRSVTPSLFPDQQEFVDQHVRVIYRRVRHAGFCGVLLGD